MTKTNRGFKKKKKGERERFRIERISYIWDLMDKIKKVGPNLEFVETKSLFCKFDTLMEKKIETLIDSKFI